MCCKNFWTRESINNYLAICMAYDDNLLRIISILDFGMFCDLFMIQTFHSKFIIKIKHINHHSISLIIISYLYQFTRGGWDCLPGPPGAKVVQGSDSKYGQFDLCPAGTYSG